MGVSPEEKQFGRRSVGKSGRSRMRSIRTSAKCWTGKGRRNCLNWRTWRMNCRRRYPRKVSAALNGVPGSPFLYDEEKAPDTCPDGKTLRLRNLNRSVGGLHWEYFADRSESATRCPLRDSAEGEKAGIKSKHIRNQAEKIHRKSARKPAADFTKVIHSVSLGDYSSSGLFSALLDLSILLSVHFKYS